MKRKPYDTRRDGKRAQCSHLTPHGVRCRRMTRRWEAIIEDPELTNHRWFYVAVCDKHTGRDDAS